MVPPVGTALRPTLRRTTTLTILGAIAILLMIPTVAFATPASVVTSSLTVPTVSVPALSVAAHPAMSMGMGGESLRQLVAPQLHGPARSLLPADRVPLSSALSASDGPSGLRGAIASLATGAGPAFGISLQCTASSPTAASCANGPSTASHPSYYGGFGWQNATPGSGTIEFPGQVSGGSMAWDPFDRAIIYFGGCDSVSCPDDQTWAYFGFWENVTDFGGYIDAPPAVYDAAMDYDYSEGAVLLFGGCGAVVCPMNETWLFSGGYWINDSGPTCISGYCSWAPAPRYAASMAFANGSADNATILFGGCLDTLCYSPDSNTYAWIAYYGYWVNVTTYGAPSGRAYSSMVDYPYLTGLILFGGCTAFSCALDDTWFFTGISWTNESVAVSYYGATPEGRGAAQMTYDARLGEILLTGGDGVGGVTNDTWELSCFTYYGTYCGWANITPFVNLPGGIDLGMMAAESSSYAPILIGGDCTCRSSALFETYVFEPLFTGAPTVGPNPAKTGQVVTFTANLAGGTPSYFGTWYTGNSSYYYGYGILNTTSTYSAAGNYTVELFAEDAYGVEFLFTTNEIVGSVAAQATVAHATDDVGALDTFSTVAPSGGSSPYSYNWSFGDGTYGTSADSVSHAYSAVGTYTANLTVMDAYGLLNTSTVSVTVGPAPTVTAAASATTVDVGSALTFTPTAAGGIGPYTYAWAFADTQTSTSTAPSHTYAAAGTFKVTVTVTDSVGGTATGSVSVTVNPAVSGTATATPTTVAPGASVSFTASGAGGSGTYTYAWVFGDGSAKASTASTTHAYTNAGTYTAWVWINDSLGGSYSHSVAVTVQTSSGTGSSTSSGSLPGWALWAVLGLVIVVVAVLALVLLTRRRKQPPTSTPAVPPAGAAGGSAPPPPPGAP